MSQSAVMTGDHGMTCLVTIIPFEGNYAPSATFRQPRMTPNELRQASIKSFGESDCVAALAAFLGRERTQIWRYLSGKTPIPNLVARAITAEAKRRRRA
jgi:hypothetical protein